MTEQQMRKLVSNLNEFVLEATEDVVEIDEKNYVDANNLWFDSVEDALAKGKWEFEFSSFVSVPLFSYTIEFENINSFRELLEELEKFRMSLDNVFIKNAKENFAWWLTKYLSSDDHLGTKLFKGIKETRYYVNFLEATFTNGINLIDCWDFKRLAEGVL